MTFYFLALYKLGWAYYNQATAANQEEYKRAVDVFGRLVASYDQLSTEQQARLGLQAEAIEYMAIAFTQIGGAEAADAYFASRENGGRYRLPVMRRVAQSLRDQGDFGRAVEAYRAVITEAPTDSAALGIQREIVDIYQNRVLDPEKAQEARLQLVENFGPNSNWARANPSIASQANAAREEALRQSAQFRLSQAQQRNDRARFAEAAQLYGRYIQEFAQADSAQRASLLYGEALFGQGNYAEAGTQYARAAYEYSQRDTALAQRAGQNAIVAFDSALVRNKNDRGAQDAMFSAVDRYVAAFPETELAKRALIQKGKRASESQRWDVMAQTFQTYAQRYPNDPYTPTAQKLVGDAMYRGGQYAEAQTQWETAQSVATSSGRRALADSIARIRTGAAATFADTLVKQGEYRRAAEEIYVTIAERNPNSERAPEALRDAIRGLPFGGQRRACTRRRGRFSSGARASHRADAATGDAVPELSISASVPGAAGTAPRRSGTSGGGGGGVARSHSGQSPLGGPRRRNGATCRGARLVEPESGRCPGVRRVLACLPARSTRC